MNTPSNNQPNSIPLSSHLKKGEFFSVRREDLEREQMTAFNRHDHLELILVEQGTLGCFIEGGFFTAVSGDLVVVNPLQVHRLIRVTQEPLVTWTLNFDGKGIQFGDLEIWKQNFEELVKDSKITELFREIVREKKQGLVWNSLYIQSLIQLILLCLLRKYAKTSSEESNTPPLLQAIMSYIHTNFSQPLTLETIGNVVGISRWYLSKYFKKETGISIIDYINQYRCSQALVLLLKSEYPISKISEMCGFSSLEYFSRVYTKQYGHSPTHERELRGESDISLGLFASSLAASTEGAQTRRRSSTKNNQKPKLS